MGISVVINTLNEEENIKDCLLSIQNFADEIIICDMRSEDNTINIATQMGAKIFLIDRMEGMYQRMRFLGIQKASHDWIFQIDADERMTEPLKLKLKEIAASSSYSVVKIRILFWFFGDWVRNGGFFTNNYPRFFKRQIFLENFKESTIQVHSDWTTISNVPDTITLAPDYYLLHYAYPTIEKYVTKTLGFYARIEGEQYFLQGKRFQIWRLILSPIKTFVERYILKGGFKDGIRGLILAILYAGYRFTFWANIWYLEFQLKK
jgi:glycosyltransferase involved in cell wall biosynthesis